MKREIIILMMVIILVMGDSMMNTCFASGTVSDGLGTIYLILTWVGITKTTSKTLRLEKLINKRKKKNPPLTFIDHLLCVRSCYKHFTLFHRN